MCNQIFTIFPVLRPHQALLRDYIPPSNLTFLVSESKIRSRVRPKLVICISSSPGLRLAGPGPGLVLSGCKESPFLGLSVFYKPQPLRLCTCSSLCLDYPPHLPLARTISTDFPRPLQSEGHSPKPPNTVAEPPLSPHSTKLLRDGVSHAPPLPPPDCV